MATQIDLRFTQGDPVEYSFELTAGPTVAEQAPFDLTARTLIAQMRRNVADVDATVDAEFTVTIDTPASDGTGTISLTSEQTQSLRGAYVWDLEVVGVRTFMAGIVTVEGDVSRG